MRKFKTIAAASVVAVAALSFTACSGGGSSSTAAGSYELTEVSDGSEVITIEELNDAMSELGMDAIVVTLDLAEDGTFEITDSSGMLGLDGFGGEWKEGSSAVTLTVEGESLECDYDGSTIVLAVDGASMTFAK